MILIDNRQTTIVVSEELNALVSKVIEKALQEENVNIDYEVSVIFVDNISIREINSEYRNIDKETDVLSFPMLCYPKDLVFKDVYISHKFDESDLYEGRLILGDIAISLEMAEVQRKEYEHSFYREVAYLTVHSILHLLGYDHMDEREKAIMRHREEEILTSLHMER